MVFASAPFLLQHDVTRNVEFTRDLHVKQPIGMDAHVVPLLLAIISTNGVSPPHPEAAKDEAT